ncbi:hypothetical protein [Rhizobium binae]|uniref:hypothetical protein n=1 Tax=Rhizobium binae TaxID=1138190 RepID=UPI001C8379C0|nr:hypothetical protein [Rhizobium binae]MBX4961373.1 hypothetical protein [Rhizobium binae]
MTIDPHGSDEDIETALVAYRRRLQGLRAQARDLDVQIAKAEAIILLMEEELYGALTSPAEDSQSGEPTTKLPKRPQTNGELVVSVTKKILREAGRPLSRQEILARMIDLGFTLTVANPPKFIGKTLWAHEDFVHVDQQGYWLASDTRRPTGAHAGSAE